MSNMKLWDAVSKTDPSYTTKVNQRGGFTSISAQYQIMSATKQFGPIGIGWGYICGDPVFHDNLVMVPVTLWHSDRMNTYGPMFGCDEWKDSKGRIDSDAPKKAVTDAITKLLSQLGFNADVFLGMFDDNKYVEQRRKECAPEVKRITAEQLERLNAAADDLGVDKEAFCKHINVPDMSAIPADRFEDAMALIHRKKKEAK